MEQLRGIEERCAQLAADKDSLNEENEELARELNERKKEIKELQNELLLLQQPKEVACGTHINPLECCVQPSATPCASFGVRSSRYVYDVKITNVSLSFRQPFSV